MSKYPSEQECINILKRAGCNRRVIIHCCTVKTVAEQLAKKIPCNRDLVIAGALLHDVGRAVDHSIFHAVTGADMMEELSMPKEIQDIVRKHTGAGLDNEDVKTMGLPPGDYIPSTIEEKIVAHADNMVSDNILVPHEHSVEKLVSKGAVRGAERMERLHLELSKLYGEDLDVIVHLLGEHPRITGPCGKYIS